VRFWSPGAADSVVVTVPPLGPGPVLQVFEPFAGATLANGSELSFRESIPYDPKPYDLKLRNMGASGTLTGLTATVQYTSGTTGWIQTTLSSTQTPAVLHVAYVRPSSGITPNSSATVTVSSTTPGVQPFTIKFVYVLWL
jgi:hypothetical protein